MSKFVIIDDNTVELKKGEYLIDKPNFLEEIKANKAKAPKSNLTGGHHLRALLDAITFKYAFDTLTGLSFKVHSYEGRPFSSDEELNDIVVQIIQDQYPSIFTQFLDKKVKERPSKTELVYVVKSKIPFMYETLYNNGLSEVVKEKTVKEKSGKVVGKPAVTNEQAELLKQQTSEE